MSSPLEQIKDFEKTHSYPRVRLGVAIDPAVTVSHQAMHLDLPLFIEKLAAGLAVALTPEKNMPGLENAPNILDFSLASLEILDEQLQKVDYPSWFTKDYFKQWFIPALGAYIAVVCIRHIPKLSWKFAATVEKCVLQPPQGGRLFYPWALAQDAVYSGYRTKEFFDRVEMFSRIRQ